MFKYKPVCCWWTTSARVFFSLTVWRMIWVPLSHSPFENRSCSWFVTKLSCCAPTWLSSCCWSKRTHARRWQFRAPERSLSGFYRTSNSSSWLKSQYWKYREILMLIYRLCRLCVRCVSVWIQIAASTGAASVFICRVMNIIRGCLCLYSCMFYKKV